MKQLQSLIRVVPGMALLAVAGTVCAADRIVPEGELGKYWTVADGHSLSVAGYPETRLADAANACVAIAYRVNEHGLTSLPVVLKVWDSVGGRKASPDLHEDAFARAAAMAVTSWRFQPVAGTEPTPSVTVSTFGFMADDVASKAAVRSHCRISNDELAAIGGDSALGKGHGSRAGRIAAAFWPPNTMPSQRIHADNVSRRLQPAVVQSSR